eukprot:scaffold6679_cov80-Skeletonema_marinoi.AAC.1
MFSSYNKSSFEENEVFHLTKSCSALNAGNVESCGLNFLLKEFNFLSSSVSVGLPAAVDADPVAEVGGVTALVDAE